MPTQTIKLRLYLSQAQTRIFGQWNYADQMFRNYAVKYLRDRYTARKAWTREHHQDPAYLEWKAQVESAKAEIKVFNVQYPSKEDRKKATDQGLRPVYPAPIDPVFEDDFASLSAHLTGEISRSKQWLLRQLGIMHAAGMPVPQIKKFPQSVSECVNGLPLSLRKGLQRIAYNEGVLFYTLFAPRTVFNQTIQDLKKTYSKAYANLREGKPVHQAGFPRFHKISRHGGVRLQVDARSPGFTNAWKAQQIQLTEIGILKWKDSGYRLPDAYAKMITVKKSPCGHYFATWAGTPAYKDGKAPLALPVIPSARSPKEFLDQLTEGFDLNRESGFPIMVGSQERVDPDGKTGHDVSPLTRQKLAALQRKIKKQEARIEYFQQQASRQYVARKQAKKKNKWNPNSAHRNPKNKSSHRALKTQDKINFAYDVLNNLRDFYKLAIARLMVRGRRVIMTEDLDVKGMQEAEKLVNQSAQQHKNNKRSQHHAGFGKLNRHVEEVAIKQGVVILKCDQFDPTSQICSHCGHRWGKIDLSVRTIQCAKCKTVHDRDENATTNSKFLSLYRYISGRSDLNNLEALRKVHPLPISKQTKHHKQHREANASHTRKALAESVDVGEVIEIDHLEQISHEEIRAYILDSKYPIDVVLKACQKPKTASVACGHPGHPAEAKWLTPSALVKSRQRQKAYAV